MYITMLGISGSGKTSYMSGLYEALGAQTYEGFRISPVAVNSEALPEMLAIGKFEEISFNRQTTEDGFPPGTQQTTLWLFDLMHQTSKVGDFNWIDYRGGILTDSPNEIITSERKLKEIGELTGHIELTDAVMIFIDSIILTHYENIREARRHTGIDTMVNLLLSIDKKNPSKNLTFVIVLTKIDGIEDDKWKNHDFDLLVKRGLEAFENFITYAKNKPNWTIGIVPVSSVGLNCATTEVKNSSNWRTSIEIDSIIQTFPKPLNMAEPLFFALGQTLKFERELSRQKIADRRNKRRKILENSSLIRDFWFWITKKSNPKDALVTLDEQEAAFRAKLQQFERFIEPLLSVAYKVVKIIQGWAV